jgi:gliding motility-associated-like protein
MKGDKTVKIIGGPLITADGTVFEGVADSSHFLFKINNKGEKIWETQRYKGLGKASAVSILPDKSIYLTLITQSANKKNLTHIVFLNDGLVSSISNILLPQNVSSTLLNQQVDNQNINTLIGSIDPFIAKKGDINSFLFQYEVMGKNMECLETEPSEMVSINNTPTKFEPINPVFTSFSFTQENIFRPDTVTWKRVYNPFCLTEIEELPLVIDTTLACDATWKITLPGEEYIWWDNVQSKERIITVPGTYKAYKLSCSDPSIHNFTLKKENCDCPFFIPNAFSPNNDGTNDFLEVYSACEITDYQWKVYSRWGNLIDSGMNTAWSGNVAGELISQGSYIFIITYTLKDVNGKMIKGQKEQIINLVR